LRGGNHGEDDGNQSQNGGVAVAFDKYALIYDAFQSIYAKYLPRNGGINAKIGAKPPRFVNRWPAPLFPDIFWRGNAMAGEAENSYRKMSCHSGFWPVRMGTGQ
jgi:hypothetical protein